MGINCYSLDPIFWVASLKIMFNLEGRGGLKYGYILNMGILGRVGGPLIIFLFQLWCCPGREWLSGGPGGGALYTPRTGPSVVARQRDRPGGGALYTPSTGPRGQVFPSSEGKPE